MKHHAVRTVLVAVALVLFLGGAGFAEERIQLAILLDTSNSMDGLIDQARAQLWRVVNELARAKRNGVHPRLEVALFEYGNNSLRESDGWIRMVADLTTDLDRISEKLFGLVTDGGDEYCGEVIGRAVDKLSWSASDDVLKVIYIAGNEPFDQGRVSYGSTVPRAVRKGIVVNTIFCGSADEGIATSWKDGAIRGEGRYASIDQDEAVVEVVTPFDADIIRLGQELNATYVGYGREGEESKSRQATQDQNAASMGAPASVQRSVAKAQEAYENTGWDLADAVRAGTVKLDALKDDELPPAMRKMGIVEKERYVAGLISARDALQKRINDLNEQRRVYVEKETRTLADASTLGAAILASVREQAERKGFAIK
jgi:hypothetical protein